MSTEYHTIVVDRRGNATWITLNRPEVLNAYTSEMCAELRDAVLAFQRDDDARSLVLTGAGRAFCSGGDVRNQDEVVEADGRVLGQGMVMREGVHAVNRAIHALDKPVIALVNGPAVAGGLTLAMLCDLRVAASTARLGDPSGRSGLLPDEGGAWLFPRAMGADAAYRMWLFNEIYDAPRALELGLVHEVVEPEALVARGEELTAAIAAKAPLAVRMAKRLMRRASTQTFDQALSDAETAVEIVNNSADVQEGVAAFVERRAPRFAGR